MTRWKLAVAWVALQVLFFAGWATVEAARLRSGLSILVRTMPVDPRDLLRGQYFELSYEFSRIQSRADVGGMPSNGDEIWIVLKKQEEFHVPDGAYANRPAVLERGQVALVGRMDGRRFVFGIEQYFVPEGTPTPDMSQVTVRLRVGSDGKPRIEQAYLKGLPWP